MKNKRILSIILCLALLVSLIPATVVRAVDDDSTDNGMHLSKTAKANTDGTYTITLEAYATGSKVISEVTEDVPTDIVLVLDQSGSMANPIGTVSFEPYEDESDGWGTTYHTRNQDHYENRHNGGNANLYYPLGDDTYASVSVTVEQKTTYTKITNGRNSTNNSSYTSYWANRNNLFALVDGEYQKVEVTRSGNFYYTYTYKIGDVTIATSQGNNTTPTFQGTDDGYLYLLSVDESQNKYTYTYTDGDGNIQTIGTSTGATTVFYTTLYERVVDTTAGDSRLDALKTAVTTFAENVKTKAVGDPATTEDDVNHRIAVVGFATGDYSSDSSKYPYYQNTELFIGSNQYNYNQNASTFYGVAFQDMSTDAGYNNVIASRDALDANGATYINFGIDMANKIFAANPIPEGERRNRVIVVFTDGEPGWNGYDSNVADPAITLAETAKNDGITVYTVGIFSGADATTAGDKNGSNTEKANYFMQQLSSNNGKPQNPSYYLSAADAKTLNNIFEQIANQIESGGSSTTLDSETVIKDIISSSFTLPAGATADNITLETYHCTGKSGDEYTWSKNATAMGASATISGDQVSVTGFDFAENYVGTETAVDSSVTYRGDKLVITFNVVPKAGFLGGNDVYTNASAGVYENSDAQTPVLTFERPQVNVPTEAITITAADKNVYLMGELSAEGIRSGITVKAGNVELSVDPTAVNYGLEAWQTEYVDITLTIKDSGGNDVANLDDLTSDETYTVSVSVTPKTEVPISKQGTTAVKHSAEGTFKVNVFKPEMTYADGTVDFGSVITASGYVSDKVDQTYEADNFVSGSLVWKHGETSADDVTMNGAAPTLVKTYQYDAEDGAKVDSSGKVVSTDYVGVNATVSINGTDVTSFVSFAHYDNCEYDDCNWDEDHGTYEFLLHVINKVADLTIVKNGGSGELFEFTVVCPEQNINMTVCVPGGDSITLKDLPIGTYTVTEDNAWSYRYTCNPLSDSIALKPDEDNSLTFTNTLTYVKWLGGETFERNIFDGTSD